ncbi:type II toxin-antitoxin system RelE/ParE family toxin [Campylobacter sp. RM16188]|uniref:type II toxin-antitoxin system RelE/ParE family toxin n=1 Tax=Campylobacter sp. RM16188 TaxID=1705725 RepID=UPI001552DD9A|nr:type II toxin-antitoxin system RelE/ParE family toxin [Campylobacter sp. RM16188]
MIVYLDDFVKNINLICNFIALDSQNRADNFYDELMGKIETIEDMPLRFRKNSILNLNNVRDLIYKGYIIPFLIKNDDIYILDIYKENKWNLFKK